MSARGGDTLGGVYAQALAEAAEARGNLADVGRELAAFAATWRQDEGVRVFFLSGAIDRGAKAKTIEDVFRGRASDTFTDFLRVMLKRNRLWLLPDAAAAYVRIENVRLGRITVTLSTATQVTPSDLAAWRERLKAAIGMDPVLQHVVRPALVGGAVIRVGDVVADGSVRRRLLEIETRLRRARDLSHAPH